MDKKNFSIHPKDRSIEKRWNVFWTEHDLLTGKSKRRQAYGDINQYNTVEERLRAAEKLIDRLSSGGEPKKRSTDFGPLRAALEEMLLLRSCNLTSKTARTYQYILNHFLAHAQKERQLNAPYYIKQLKDDGMSATTINFYRCTLRTLFDDLLHESRIDHNPFTRLPKLKERRSHGRFFDESQILTVKTAILESDPALWLVCQYIFYTFIRPSELFQLRVRDVSLTRGSIIVESINSKVAKQRIVTIPETLDQILSQLRLDQYPGDYFLVGRSDAKPGLMPADKNRFYRPHRRIMKKLGFGEGYYLYSWKHTGNYFAQKAGVPLKQIQIHNGHTSLRTTDNYMANIVAQHCDELRRLMPAI